MNSQLNTLKIKQSLLAGGSLLLLLLLIEELVHEGVAVDLPRAQHNCSRRWKGTNSGEQGQGGIGFESDRPGKHKPPAALQRSAPVGKLGWCTASGKPCVSRHSPACCLYTAPPLPTREPSAGSASGGGD